MKILWQDVKWVNNIKTGSLWVTRKDSNVGAEGTVCVKMESEYTQNCIILVFNNPGYTHILDISKTQQCWCMIYLETLQNKQTIDDSDVLCAWTPAHHLSLAPVFAGSCPAHSIEQNEYLVGSLFPTRSRTVAILRTRVFWTWFPMISSLPGTVVGILDHQVYDLKIWSTESCYDESLATFRSFISTCVQELYKYVCITSLAANPCCAIFEHRV